MLSNLPSFASSGLCDVSQAKRMAMYSAVQRVTESSLNTLSMLKIDRFLADANWEIAEQTVHVQDPYKTSDEEVSAVGPGSHDWNEHYTMLY